MLERLWAREPLAGQTPSAPFEFRGERRLLLAPEGRKMAQRQLPAAPEPEGQSRAARLRKIDRLDNGRSLEREQLTDDAKWRIDNVQCLRIALKREDPDNAIAIDRIGGRGRLKFDV